MQTIIKTGLATSAAVLAVAGSAFGQTTVPVAQDYMSSGFFRSDFLRGEEMDSGHSVHRTTSPVISGVTGETTYFGFDFDWASFGGSVPGATLRVETVANGFFPDPDPSNPAEISVHTLTADPLLVVDQSLPDGPGSWLDFRDTQIIPGSIISTTTVDGLDVFEWDVTAVVNDWIANGDANFAFTVGMSALLDPEEAADGSVNSSFAGLDPSLGTAESIVVPAPASLMALGGIAAFVGRRRR